MRGCPVGDSEFVILYTPGADLMLPASASICTVSPPQLLDAVVARVRHVDVPLAVHRHALGCVELAGARALGACQDLPCSWQRGGGLRGWLRLREWRLWR